MKEIELEPIPEEIKTYFAQFGKNWWKNLSEEEKEKHRIKLREGVKKSLKRRKKKTSVKTILKKPSPEKHAESVRKSQKKYKDKEIARGMVKQCVKNGKMPHPTTLSCLDCSGKASEYDHAYGYSIENRLNVEPVCKKCHSKRGVLRNEFNRGVKRKI